MSYAIKQALGFPFELLRHLTMFSFLRKYFSPFVVQNENLSLLQVFKPLHFCLLVVGLFPSSIEFPSGKRDFTIVFKSSSISLACTLLMTVLISVSFGLHMLELSVSSKENAFTIDQFTLTNYISNLVLMLLFAGMAYICALKNRNIYIKILNEMAGCWADLPNSASDSILGQLRVQVNCLVLGSLLLMLIMQLVVTGTSDVPTSKIVLIAVTFNLPEMVQFTLLAFYFVMIVMIIAIMKNIEENFALILPMRRVNGVDNHYVRLESGSALASLRQLRGVYARALAVKRQVNAAFQAPLLFLLVQAFHSLICDAHGVYHGLTYYRDTFSTHDVVEEFFWVFYQLIKFHILGFSSAILKLQADKIGRALYNISAHVNKEITQYKSWADINDEITLHLEIQHFASLMKFQDILQYMAFFH
uniref:Gustatory receptor n=1 Tax=Epiphyas postvittana TaxID=65032 RepID=A0A0K8TV34_EPIPO